MKKIILLTCMLLCIHFYGWAQESEQSDDTFKVSLFTPHLEKSRNLNIQVGDSAEVHFIITQGSKELNKDVLPEGDYNIDWMPSIDNFKRRPDNSLLFKAVEKKKQEIYVKIKKGNEFVEAKTDTLYFMVWDKANVDTNVPETTEDNPMQLLKDESWNLSVTPIGGVDEGWQYYWTEGTDTLSTKSTFSVTYEDGKTEKRHIELKVLNVAEPGDTLFSKTYHYWVKSVQEVKYKISLLPSYTKENILENKKAIIDFLVTPIYDGDRQESAKNPIPKGSSINWIVDGDTVSKSAAPYTYTAKYDKKDTEHTQDISAILINGNDTIHSDTLHFVVWPKTSIQYNPEKDKPITLYEDQQCELTVTAKGGNEKGWKYYWLVNNDTLSTGNKCTIKYDGNDNFFVKSQVLNTVGQDTLFNSEYYEYQVTFAPVPMPKIEFEYTAKETDILSEDTVSVNFMLKDERNNTILSNEQLADYTWTWNGESDDTTYTFTEKNEDNENGVSKKVTLKLTRKRDNETKSDSVTFTVWPTPEASLYPKDEKVIAITKKEKKYTLSANVKGGYKKGWNYEWVEIVEKAKEKVLTKDSTCTINYRERSDSDELKVSLRLKNTSPKKEIWYSDTLYYTIKFVSVDKYEIRYESNWDKTKNNVLAGDSIMLKLKLYNVTRGKKADDSLFIWTKPSSADTVIYVNHVKEKTDTIFEPIIGSYDLDEYEVINNPFKYTIWPGLEQPVDWTMELKDENRNRAVIEKGIRSSNKFSSNTDTLKLAGGYYTTKGENIQYEFRFDKGKTLTGTMPENLDFGTNGIYADTIRCYAMNMYDKNTKLGEIEIGKQYVKVYKKPETPKSLIMKGDGTSGTWFVDNTDDIVMGYNGKTITIDKRADNNTWFKSEASKDINDKSKLYIYKTKSYEEGVNITSGRCYKDGKLETEWDGSTYQNETRGDAVTSGVNDLRVISAKATQYNINGMNMGRLTRGINIIRQEDGTVKKVFIK